MKADNSFLGFRSFLGSSSNSPESLVEEAAQLCKNMCIADATHDIKIVDNVQKLVSRSKDLVTRLRGKLEKLDVESSVQICADILIEIEKDVLHVATESCSISSESATKSTVSSISLHKNN